MIPKQLLGEGRFLKLESGSKAPATGEGQSPDGPFYAATDQELTRWLDSGGNVGLNLGPLVCVDVDNPEFQKLVDDQLPESFSVRSGSGGEHRYFQSDWSGRRAFSDSDTELGSVRSGNWYVVVPPSTHPNGNQYRVLDEKPIQSVDESRLSAFLEEATTRFGSGSANTGRAAAAGGVGGIPDIPPEYPNREVGWQTCKKWLLSNGFLSELGLSTGDRSVREFKLAKCLAEGGFSESAISATLDRLPHDSKWHERGDRYRNRTVRKAVVAACNDSYVTFNSPDESGSGAGPDEGKAQDRTMSSNDATYTTREEVVVLESDDPEEGEQTVKATVTEVEDSGEQYEFVQILAGTIEVDDTFGASPNWQTNGNGQDKTRTIGKADPEYLRVVANALEELAEEIDHE